MEVRSAASAFGAFAGAPEARGVGAQEDPGRASRWPRRRGCWGREGRVWVAGCWGASERKRGGSGRNKPIKKQGMRSDWRTQPIRGRDEGVDGLAKAGLVPSPVVQWLKAARFPTHRRVAGSILGQGRTNLFC